MRISSLLLPLTFSALVVGCGGSGGGGSSSDGDGVSQNEQVRSDGSNVSGIYATDLWPLNVNLNMNKIGTVAVERKEDDFTARVLVTRAPSNTSIRQAIYYGRRCPTIKDDTNKDAFIDISEAKAAIGLITIPLDSNLNTQDQGLYNMPYSGSALKGYTYKETSSFERMLDDLHEVETNFTDDLMNIFATDGITFPGRVVLLQGVNDSVWLPDTVAGDYGMDARSSLPIACGILWKVKKLPDSLKDL